MVMIGDASQTLAGNTTKVQFWLSILLPGLYCDVSHTTKVQFWLSILLPGLYCDVSHTTKSNISTFLAVLLHLKHQCTAACYNYTL